MLVLLDTADLKEIRKLYDLFPIDGVTTNPSILKKENQSPMERLKSIKAVLPAGAQLHAQVISETAEEIVKEARHVAKALGEDVFIKIPVSAQGLKATQILSAEGLNVTATAVFSQMQAFLAAKAGAKYVAPYVNRLDNMGSDGVRVTRDIQEMFTAHKAGCGILAASFKNAQQVYELCKSGIGAVTVAPDILDALIKHPATDKATTDFKNDFCLLAGEGKTMLDF